MISRHPTISNWNCHYVKWYDYNSTTYAGSINQQNITRHFLYHTTSRIFLNNSLKLKKIQWCNSQKYDIIFASQRIWLFIVRTAAHPGPNMLADGHKKPLLSGLSFANFENDLVRWDVHIKWPLTWRYLQRQAPNMGPHLNQFLSNPIFLWYSMGDTNVDTMGRVREAHLLKMKRACVKFICRRPW